MPTVLRRLLAIVVVILGFLVGAIASITAWGYGFISRNLDPTGRNLLFAVYVGAPILGLIAGVYIASRFWNLKSTKN